ncbi:MAG: hypothetical protein QM479_02670 [Pseudomonadota bacterium]
MSKIHLSQMNDILPFPTVEPFLPFWLQLVIVLSLAAIILIIFYLYFQQPIIKLEYQLKQGKISCREAACKLARIIDKKQLKNNRWSKLQFEVFSNLKNNINKIKFQRQNVDIKKLTSLINQVKHEL